MYYINHNDLFSIQAIVCAQKSFKCTCQFRHCKLPEEATTRGVDLQLYYKDTPTQVFSCEIFEIFRNTYFEEQKPTITLQ